MHVQTTSPAPSSAGDGEKSVAVGELLSIDGVDALAFAQAQVMSDVAALADGGWQWSGWLNPKGRLVAFFALARISPTRLLAWLPAGGAEALRDRLQRFVFRSKVTLSAPAGVRAVGAWGDAPQAPGPDGPTACLRLPDQGDGPPRWLWLYADVAAPERSPDAPGLDRDWRLADLRLGLPYVAAGGGNSEQFVPAWLSLQRLAAFSVGKGCYPGQEIVARMHFLGQSKRAAARIEGSGEPPAPMARVLDGDGAGVGDVVWSQAGADGGWQALAVLAEGRTDAVAAVAGSGPARAAS